MNSVETPTLTKVVLLRSLVTILFVPSSSPSPRRCGSNVVNADPLVLRACTALYLTADPSLNTCAYS